MEPERYPINVQLVGVLHKEKSKLYVASVLWSDQSDIVVYRSFREFKKMHRQMKKAFPPTDKLRKSDRIIPRFRDRKMRQTSGRKGPSKSVVRLKFLQKYCNDLLSCDPRVCQSAGLIQFFRPKDQDLQPEFARNSIMVMPPEEDIRREVGPGGGGNVTQPFVTETFRCVAPYETKDTKNKAFKVSVDERVDVLIKDKAGWWLVENEAKQMAWFPAPYLEKLDDDDDRHEDEMDGTSGRGALYTAVRGYKATKEDEITVTIGATVEVLQKSDNGWWLIRYNGKAGYIPTMYLQPSTRPHLRMMAAPSSLQQQSQLSRSHGNLLQPPPASFSSPFSIQPDGKLKSRSLNVLTEQPPPPPPTRTAAANTSAPAANYTAPAPTITVEMDGEEERLRSLSAGSKGSFASDSTNFSFSDDLSSSAASSTYNLSQSSIAEHLRSSRTPPPMPTYRLSPTVALEGKLNPSVSDPNLYKGPTMPKVPPRPQAQEILSRCSSITRKNAAKSSLSPTQTEMISR